LQFLPQSFRFCNHRSNYRLFLCIFIATSQSALAYYKQVKKWIQEGIVFAVTGADDSYIMNRYGKHSAGYLYIRGFLQNQKTILSNLRWN
jgi:hypothetical protein